MELTNETGERIVAAADALFEQNGRDAFPTVDAVRKTARVNMNDASTGMKAWRRAHIAQTAPAAVQVPEAVQAAGAHAVAVLWQQAQEVANASLRAAPSWPRSRPAPNVPKARPTRSSAMPATTVPNSTRPERKPPTPVSGPPSWAGNSHRPPSAGGRLTGTPCSRRRRHPARRSHVK